MVESLEPILRILVWDQLENVIVIKIRIFSSTRTAVKAGPPRAPLIFHFLFSPSLPLTWEPLAPHSPRDQKRTALGIVELN